jgi:gluconate 2-dehydrogenase gamma chain
LTAEEENNSLPPGIIVYLPRIRGIGAYTAFEKGPSMLQRPNDAHECVLETDLYGNSYELEPNDPPTSSIRQRREGVSRREVLKRAGFAGAAVVLPPVVGDSAEATRAADGVEAALAAAETPVAYETLTASAFDMLEAIVERLIPTDENGPGAKEARAAHFIDRALVGPLVAFRDTYYAGLAAIDAYAQSSKGAPFTRLSSHDQDAVLSDVEKNVATGFNGRSSAFFALLRTHTIQGMFCDPYHGGNTNFVGWDLIGYPGIRLSATAEEQRMDVMPKAVRRSAYDFPLFTSQSRRSDTHDH